MTGVEEEDLERETNEATKYQLVVEDAFSSVTRPWRQMKRHPCRRQWLFCLCLLNVFMLYPNTVVAQESTPAPVSIPDTVSPSPTPPPPTTEVPLPTEAPPTTLPPTTALPTAESTPLPTASTPPPTQMPTAPPTSAPIAPTDDPTVAPTDPLTEAPTQGPTTAPYSGAPSTFPTFFSSDAPSESPSALLDPTNEPTTSPAPTTPDTTGSPSDSPSFAPSPLPTVSITQRPSQLPSSSPTLSSQEDIVEVFMTFDNMNLLEGRSMFTFRSITKQFITAQLKSTADPPMQDLSVFINVKSQSRVQWTSERRDLRVLQQKNGLMVVFDTSVEWRSEGIYDIPALVGGTWDTQQNQDAYIAALKATGDATFQDITAMMTDINGWTPGSGGDDKKVGNDLFIIIGASVGGGLLLLLGGIALLYCRRRHVQAKKKAIKTTTLTQATPQQLSSNGIERISTEIVVDHQDDVSTLGDPMWGAGGMLIPGMEKDETIAASSFGDYEYAKAYGAAEGAPMSVATESVSKRTGLFSGSERELSTALDLGHMEEQFFSDDSSFEEQYQHGEVLITVMAPKGKLGMVIDTPSNGVPVVHAIKETSVLASQVKVGDRLLSVDGEDCTMMSAMQVSKLISERAENPSRAFVFSRARARIMSKG